MRLLVVVAVCAVFVSACGATNTCSVATCPSGCCDPKGVCQSGSSNSACGIAGNQCQVCATSQSCSAGGCFTNAFGGGTTSTGGGSGSTGGGSTSTGGGSTSTGGGSTSTGGGSTSTGGGSANTGGGTATGGGSTSTGGGSANTGGGAATGGGSTAPKLVVMPDEGAQPVVVQTQGGSIELIARALNLSSATVSFTLEPTSPSAGYLVQTGPQTARFYSDYSGFATAHVTVTADAMSSLARTISLASTGMNRPAILPTFDQALSQTAFVLGVGKRQTFAMVDFAGDTQNARGVRSTDWYLWSNGAPVAAPPSGLVQLATLGEARVYARDSATNEWASVDLSVVASTESPAVEIFPSVANAVPNGVVQLTAMVSNGSAVQWSMVEPSLGSVSSNGTYTAPGIAGIYVVQATPVGGDGSRYALATIIVQ